MILLFKAALKIDQWADSEAEVLLHLQDVSATPDLTLQCLRQLCG